MPVDNFYASEKAPVQARPFVPAFGEVLGPEANQGGRGF